MTHLRAMRVILSTLATLKNTLIWIAKRSKLGFAYIILTAKEIGFAIWASVRESADALTLDRKLLMK